ncbi:MAG: ATP-binding protein [Methylococcaceae bacterium]|nr:ATP-binding protein [Methylococcaceae bacterium]
MPWLPGSLSLRLFFIVLGGVLLAIAISNSFHHRDRAHLIEEYREHAAIEHLLDAIRLLASLHPAQRTAALQSLPRDEWLIELGSLEDDTQWEARPAIAKKLEENLGPVASVEGAWWERPSRCHGEMPDCAISVRTRIRFPEGQGMWLGYTAKLHEWRRNRKWLGFRDRDFFIIGIMAAIAWLVVRLALRPLQRMMQAAESFGRNIAHPPIDESGPTEVRRAAQAFNTMQKQIRAYMAERTQILAAVTHDLKTPMTRMRLRLENCTDEALKDKLRADLAAMQSLVEEGLELARSLDTVESMQLIDLDALLQSLCDDLDESGLDVAYQGTADQGIVVTGQPNALRRVFENLIDNAIKYGQHARVRLERRDDTAWVSVRDSGPGIPQEQLENVFRPFVRLEASRSRETGGTGLGLAIAVNLLRTHHGEVTLSNLPEGGLEVRVQLPIASVPT